MKLSTKIALWGVATVFLSAGCRDAAGPIERSLPVPTQVSKTVGPPAPRTYILGSAPGGAVYLSQYLRDTWSTLIASGAVALIAEDPLPNASPLYIYPGGPVGITGRVDARTEGGGCVLHIKISDNLPGFGNCGTPGITDTLLFPANATPRAIRGPLPKEHMYECSNVSSVCHSVNLYDYSEIIEQPIPVVLNKLTSSQRTANFPVNNYPGIRFTASRTPDSIWVRNGRFPHPITVTLWQWIGADSTRLASNGYCLFPTANPLCNFYPQESGRMVVKAFTGGWEQTSSVTVQCLMSPADTALNDSMTDFEVRSAFLKALDSANVDSLPGAGFSTLLGGRGWKNEAGGSVYKWNDSTVKPLFEESTWGVATECARGVDPHAPLPPGAVRRMAFFHVHPTEAGKPVFGCLDQGRQRFAQSPADTLPSANPRLPYMRSAIGTNGGGSDDDWAMADSAQHPVYVLDKGGKVWRLDPGGPNLNNPNKWQALGGRCQWVK